MTTFCQTPYWRLCLPLYCPAVGLQLWNLNKALRFDDGIICEGRDVAVTLGWNVAPRSIAFPDDLGQSLRPKTVIDNGSDVANRASERLFLGT